MKKRGLVWTLAGMLALMLPMGCGGKGNDDKPMPMVTLIERKPIRDGVQLRFKLSNVDRYNWERKALAANILSAGDTKMTADGPVLGKPESDIIIELVVTKKREDTQADVTLSWGPEGGEIKKAEPDLLGPGGMRNAADVSDYEGMRVTQIMKTCGAPDKDVRFDPDKGLDLIELGHGDKTVGVRIWASGKIVVTDKEK